MICPRFIGTLVSPYLAAGLAPRVFGTGIGEARGEYHK
jgi:hypothetical protein